MIIVNLIGGLGNQMFQYALGRRLALLNDATLKFDLENLRLSRKLKLKKWVLGLFNIGITMPRNYGLYVFNIEENVMTRKEIQKLNLPLVSEPEPKFCFHPEILQTKGDCYLKGFWQAEKYFKDIEDGLRKDFTLKKEFSIDDLAIAKEIKNGNAVSLHIRRGDYVTKAVVNKFHGTCSLKYYEDAVEYICQKGNNPKFYIFSDDIAWVKKNLNIKNDAVFVSDGKLKDYEELTLMTYCKHNIIANSSFSWWGAWLNPQAEKIVIAPKNWLSDAGANTCDLIPENWIRL